MLVFGNNIIELDVVDSTNDYLINLSKQNNIYEGTVIFSHCQLNGRGQRNSEWISNPGENLMCSIFIKPSFLSPSNYFLISKIIAIAVQKVVSSICIDSLVEIKWPNDIYVNKEKIGGILIENQFRGVSIYQSVIGLGLNINQTYFESIIATSLKLKTEKEYLVKDILKKVLVEFEKLYLALKRNDFYKVENLYLRSLMNYDKRAIYRVRSQRVIGKIKNVKNNGLLEVEINNSIEYFSFKEILFEI